jgi:hypothetical protein
MIMNAQVEGLFVPGTDRDLSRDSPVQAQPVPPGSE